MNAITILNAEAARRLLESATAAGRKLTSAECHVLATWYGEDDQEAFDRWMVVRQVALLDEAIEALTTTNRTTFDALGLTGSHRAAVLVALRNAASAITSA